MRSVSDGIHAALTDLRVGAGFWEVSAGVAGAVGGWGKATVGIRPWEHVGVFGRAGWSQLNSLDVGLGVGGDF
jgi:hypothetical protein